MEHHRRSIHGILVLQDLSRRGTACRAPTAEQFGQPVPGSLPTILRSFKSAATKYVNEIRGTPGAAFWQRNYYEQVVRTEIALTQIRHYSRNNPGKWDLDRNNPTNLWM